MNYNYNQLKNLINDLYALLEAKETLDPTGDCLNWHADLPIAKWTGVSVEVVGPQGQKRVTQLKLDGIGLQGEIPLVLAKLTRLSHLNLANNNLTGRIPTALGDCGRMIELEEFFTYGNEGLTK